MMCPLSFGTGIRNLNVHSSFQPNSLLILLIAAITVFVLCSSFPPKATNHCISIWRWNYSSLVFHHLSSRIYTKLHYGTCMGSCSNKRLLFDIFGMVGGFFFLFNYSLDCCRLDALCTNFLKLWLLFQTHFPKLLSNFDFVKYLLSDHSIVPNWIPNPTPPHIVLWWVWWSEF